MRKLFLLLVFALFFFQSHAQSFTIIGKKYVAQYDDEAYRISPVAPGYSFSWSYTGTGIIFDSDTVSELVRVYYKNTATDAALRCRIYDSATTAYSYVTLDIVVDHSEKNTLPKVQCDSLQSQVYPCTGKYIDAFTFGAIQNLQTGCSPVGMEDYTSSEYTTELYMGQAYAAEIRIGSNQAQSGSNYVGLWLDYNNDGDFDDASDFLLTSYSQDTSIRLNDIRIKYTDITLNSYRRLRVKVRATGLFTEAEGCGDINEAGETEDYKVKLIQSDNLEVPVLLTPNDDGKNDLFVIKGKTSTNCLLRVMDKTGNVLVERNEYDNSWDGKDDKGSLMERGTYYYYFKNGNGQSSRGYFELKY